jgi:nicotinate phosphoribosyltransferase
MMSMTLLTDLYQLTMAYGYWKLGLHDREAVFHVFFRQAPFGGGYAIAAGLEDVASFIDAFGYSADDVAYLAGLTGNDDAPLFEEGFLAYLAALELSCDLDAVPEGTPVFPHAPLMRIRGPLLHAQLLETPLLNLINFPTLIATKSSRICRAAQGEPVLEFGLRRAQGIDGALTASRAAYLGGCAATSNVLAGRRYGIPVKGTHAHSWIMALGDDASAFEAWADAMPNNCVFLVDTFDTLDGVREAARVGRRLEREGHTMVGIRLDSGDLAELSIQARQLLDEAGLPDTSIVASNDLDEHRIADLKARGARITVWGVGTRLVTAHDQPALGGVCKLGAIQGPDGAWGYRLKLSEDPIKVSTPGCLQVRRYLDEDGTPLRDVLYDVGDPQAPDGRFEDLLIPIFERGRRVWEAPPLADVRARSATLVDALPAGVTRPVGPDPYPVELEARVQDRKTRLLAS